MISSARVKKLRTHRLPYKKSGSWIYTIFACITLSGVLLGSLWEGYARASSNEYAGYFVLQYLARYEASVSFRTLLGSIVWPSMFPLLFLLYNGFSCIGIPFVLFVPLLKGFSIGSISGYLYSTYGLQGMATVLILFFLPQMIQLWAVLLLSQASAHASIGLLMHHFTGDVINVTDRLARMLRMSAKALLLTLTACVLESILTVVFAPVLLK